MHDIFLLLRRRNFIIVFYLHIIKSSFFDWILGSNLRPLSYLLLLLGLFWNFLNDFRIDDVWWHSGFGTLVATFTRVIFRARSFLSIPPRSSLRWRKHGLLLTCLFGSKRRYRRHWQIGVTCFLFLQLILLLLSQPFSIGLPSSLFRNLLGSTCIWRRLVWKKHAFALRFFISLCVSFSLNFRSGFSRLNRIAQKRGGNISDTNRWD